MAKDRDDSDRHDDQDFPLFPEHEDLDQDSAKGIPLEDSDSAVNLGEPAPSEEAGSDAASVESWASLVEDLDEPGSPANTRSEDLTAADEDEVIVLGDSSVDLGESVPEIVEEVGSSAVVLGEESYEPEVVSGSGIIIDEADVVSGSGIIIEEADVVDGSGVILDESGEQPLADQAASEVTRSEEDSFLLEEEPALELGEQPGTAPGEHDQLSIEDSGVNVGGQAGTLGSLSDAEESLGATLHDTGEQARKEAAEAEAEGDEFLLAEAGQVELEPENVVPPAAESDVFHLADDPGEVLSLEDSGLRLDERPEPTIMADSGSQLEELIFEEEPAGPESAQPEPVGMGLEGLDDQPEEELVLEEPHDLDVEEVVQAEGGSSLHLDSEPLAEPSSASRDLIAEAVESGTGLDDGLRQLLDPDDIEMSSEEEITVEAEPGEVTFEPEVVAESASSVDLGDPGGSSLEELGLLDSSGGVEVTASEVVEDDLLGTGSSGVGLEEEVVVGTSDLVTDSQDEIEVTQADALSDGEMVPPARGGKDRSARVARAPSRGRGGAWVGGTVLGTLIGAGACIGLWLGGIEPPESWKSMVGLPASEQSAPVTPSQPGTPGLGQPSFVLATEHLANGDLDKAQQAGIEQVEPDRPEHLVSRGKWRWQKYLQDQIRARAPVKVDDPAVVQAIEDLQKANTADARLLLGQIHVLGGNLTEAEKIYQQGAMEFQGDRRFEAALIRLQLLQEDQPAAQTRAEPLPASALALVLLALQEPMPMPVPPADADQGLPEAGFEFWAAVRLAREQKYAEAIALLKKAQQQHQDRRFLRLGKAQNPDSDPTEEIFLRATRELVTYWELKEKLRGGGYLAADQKDPLQAIDLALADAQESKKVKQLADRLLADKIIEQPADVVKGVEQLLADRKTDATKITDLTTMLTGARKQVTDLTTMLTEARKTGEDLSTRLKEVSAREMDLKKSLDGINQLADDAVRALKATGHLDPAAQRAQLAEGVQAVIRIAAIKDPEGTIRGLRQQVTQLQEQNVKDVTRLMRKAEEDLERLDQTRKQEIKKLEDTLAERWQPAEMLPVWLAALQDRSRTDLSTRALTDVARVTSAEGVPAEARAQALVIQGLAQRNQSKYAEAAESLGKAREILPPDSPWHRATDVALREAASPAEYHGLRAQRLYNEGKTEEALAALEQVLAIVPQKEPLLARRSLLLIDQAIRQSGGRPPFNDPALTQARKDALEADKAGLAEASFALGRLAELTGQRAEAITQYREALKRHPALDEAGARYRVALARILSRPEQGWMPAPPRPEAKPPAADPVGQRDEADGDALRGRPDLLLTLVALMLQAPWEQPSPDDLEAQRLADEILKAPSELVPFEARAQALAIKGLWSQALLTYAEGLKRYLRQDHAQGLEMLIRNHPALKRPDSLKVPNPLEAERQYGIGLRHYFADRYPEAEEHLLRAVELFDEDARYFYFLGLARLAQNKRDAYEDFTQGARLERQSQPSRAAVSTALERVQGPVRRILNEARLQAQ